MRGRLEREVIAVLIDPAALDLTGRETLEREEVIAHRARDLTVVGAKRHRHAALRLHRVDDLVRVVSTLHFREIAPERVSEVRKQAENETAVGRHARACEDPQAEPLGHLAELGDVRKLEIILRQDQPVEASTLRAVEE